LGDGAVWIWRLADDRWPQARQRLDFYHFGQFLREHPDTINRIPG
jgi:hypothetical protein